MKLLPILSSLLIAGDLLSVEARISGGRIVGEDVSNIQTFPFMVSIQVLLKDGTWDHHCGGSILTSNAVLTAAHCITTSDQGTAGVGRPVYRNTRSFRVVAGVSFFADERNPDAQVLLCSRFEMHPRHDWYINDVGVITLNGHFRWSITVQPLAFFSADKAEAVRELQNMKRSGVQCSSPGWGTTNTRTYQPSPQLKVAASFLLTTKQCSDDFCSRPGWERTIYSNFCQLEAYRVDKVCVRAPNGVLCKGDSGGPLVCNGAVFGVYSWFPSCRIGSPYVYTNIGTVLDLANRYRPPQ